MAEFEVNLTGLKGAVTKEENVIKSLQKEIERLDVVITSSALNQSGFGGILDALKTAATQLQEEKNGVEQLKNCLSDAISLYEQTENNLAQGGEANNKIKQSIEKLGELLDELLKKEKYGECDGSSVMSEDPVNLSTGNFIYDHTDLAVKGEIPLQFRRFYNALDVKQGVLGVRFLHNYEISLETKNEGTNEESVIVCMGDGQRKSFVKVADGHYVGERAALENLTKDENGYQLEMISGERYYFNKKGILLRQEDQNGRGINFTYHEETGLLQRAESDNGTYLCYQYDNTDKLISVSDMENRTVLLSYENDNLTSAQLADGQTISYTYTENGRMETVTNANQTVVLKNHYLPDYRVSRQDFPDGGYMTFEYDDAGHRTTLTERNGSKTIYIQDEKYRNTDILYEDGTAEHFEYNEKNQKIKAVDRNGNTSRMSYDNRGNITQMLLESGLKINYTYDGNNKLLSLKINGKEKLHNTYDAKGNLLTAINADGTTSKVTYDEQGRVICIEEDGGNITHLFYDEAGNVNKIVDALGNETGYIYDRLGRAVETTDANGNKTSYEYDAADRLTRVVNPLGAERTYQYTATGKVSEMRDFDGYTLKAAYNNLNKVSSYMDKEGNETHFAYDKMWNISSKTTPDGAVMEYHYNADNRLAQISLLEEGSISYEYDGNGNQIAKVDPEGNRTIYTYDEQNRRTSATTADGAITSYHYDEDGNLAIVCDAMGNEYTYTYDEMGRRISETDPLGNTTTYQYCLGGKMDTIVYPNGAKQTFEYDSTGRLTKMTRADGTSTSLKYDKVGNLIEETNNVGQTYRYEYDALNRRTSIVAPNGGQRTFAYDAVGHMTKMTDEKGNETAYVYSPNGNLTHVIDALGNEAHYEYDCMNRLCKEERVGTVEEIQSTTYEWNRAGQMVAMTDPLGYQETYNYNRNGMLLSKTDRDGYQTSYTYDAVGNLTNILYEDGREVAYSYNALRQLKEVSDWLGKTSIEMDALGRPLCVTTPDGKTLSYRWGNAKGQTDMTYPDGTTLHYDYDEAGRLKALSDGTNTTTYAYNEAGKLAEKILPNGIHTTYSYNELGRIESLMHEGDTIAEGYRFTYDVNGNKIQSIRETNGEVDENRSFSYEYDALNQLVRVNRQNQLVRTYAYDAFGNRIEKQDFTGEDAVRTTYQYNAKNQLVTEVENELIGEKKTYSYDGRGNLIQMMQAGQLRKQFTFDETNQMNASFEVANQITKAARYNYNGLGQRVGQDIFKENAVENIQAMAGLNPAETQVEKQLHYLLDMTRTYNNLLETQDNVSGKQQRFFWDADVVAMQEEGEESFYLQDAQGSVMSLTDAAGKTKERYEFDEFGMPLEESFALTSQPFAFAGYQMDAVGGMYFAQARRYDASAGRFISEDKVRGFIAAPFTLNHYGYCWNRPVDMVDLDGRWPSWDDVKDWWNTNVYGEETEETKTIIKRAGRGWADVYAGREVKKTTSSTEYTGEIMKLIMINKDGENGIKATLNSPSKDLGKGWKVGAPTTAGISVGVDEATIELSTGVDLGKLNINIPVEIGVSMDEWLSVDIGLEAGWGDYSVGIKLAIALAPCANTKIELNYTHPGVQGDDEIEEKEICGAYMRSGLVWGVVIAGVALGKCASGMDPASVIAWFWQVMQSFADGVCPLS